MPQNPETKWIDNESPEVQELLDSTKANGEKLKWEVETISKTRKEINKRFSSFFEKLKKIWWEVKEWNISKALAILFWKENTGSQQPSETTWSEPIDNPTETPTPTEKSTPAETTTEAPTESPEKEPNDSEIVSVKKYIKDIKLDMRYATTNNFTWQKIYEDSDAKLRYWTIKKLKKVQDKLMKKWYSLKIWDAYRPQSAQERLWSIRPDPTLVANPEKWSSHTKWNTIDITLVKSDWSEIPMPSEFDDSNKKKIDRDYSDLTTEQRDNAKILEDEMVNGGFKWYKAEWWHYSDKTEYPIERWN